MGWVVKSLGLSWVGWLDCEKLGWVGWLDCEKLWVGLGWVINLTDPLVWSK